MDSPSSPPPRPGSEPPRVIPDLVDALELRALAREPDVRVVDVRWKLGDPSAGRTAYGRGHIPGAVFADIDADLAAPPGPLGRHPVPSPEAFAAAMQRLGIGDDTRVIAYDDSAGATAGRLWFLLRYFGHETCALLDGGLTAYVQTGAVLETSAPPELPGVRFTATPRPELVVDKAWVASHLAHPDVLLLDARSEERYLGLMDPVDARAGHIPSAVLAHFAANVSGGRFLPTDRLADRFASLGVGKKAQTVVYCGSGVTACHDLLALALSGRREAKLYAGSWSEWSGDRALPMETGGAEPGE
jgi:thiosulfate/3-mercaptopyruvate sulfurtransferase